ncbi:MAG: DUF1501 domain-containing protein [Planctomycetes bacterium]|nr:DUF1501 domain-containing protein [Planctomycetota bacterium]
MNIQDAVHLSANRRTFLGRSAAGIGAAALATLLGQDRALAAPTKPGGVVNPLHHAAKVKRIIFLCQAGGPSHLETFDHKPKLAEMNGKPMPTSYTKGQPIAQLQGKKLNCLGPQHKFEKFGSSRQHFCGLFKHLGTVADEICIINSMVTEAINHDPAHTYMNTGSLISGRPAMGSWLLYGLGNETDNLPGFVVMTSIGRGGQAQPIASRQWHSGFLPSRYQGVEFRSKGDPVMYVTRPKGVGVGQQQDVVDAVKQLNGLLDREVADPEIATRIAQYELAAKMQASVPELMDVSNEPKAILDLYGTKGADGSFAGNCLLARRLAERGVRFIQLYHRGWDMHGGVKKSMVTAAKEVDQASAALIKDLKQRGMLKDTLIIWGGEFGRTPQGEPRDIIGRDHHIDAYSMWLAGGGIKGGAQVGKTDELGYYAVEDKVHVHDLQATVLHCMGLNHEKLTYRFQGRDYRLTDVAGNVVPNLLA